MKELTNSELLPLLSHAKLLQYIELQVTSYFFATPPLLTNTYPEFISSLHCVKLSVRLS